MPRIKVMRFAIEWALWACLQASAGSGSTVEVSYLPAPEPGRLQVGVTYTLWIPPGVPRLRGILVHQHGCGAGACKGGETAAYDLHWQALARKWECALLGPSYQQSDQQDCRLWCDPRNGSDAAFLRALSDLASNSGHPELETVPWALWGHSGGGTWASLMEVLHPDRTLAVWLRSGTAYPALEREGLLTPAVVEALERIPVMCNPGAREKDDKRFGGAWSGTFAMWKAYRARGIPIGFAPDPRTSHECGDSRYLAIPFFDACLAQRLPEPGSSTLRSLDPEACWLAAPLSLEARPARLYPGAPEEAVWLPSPSVARAWMEYVKTGAVSDDTPPPPAFDLRTERLPGGGVGLTWNAVADLESGIRAFLVIRDGALLDQVPHAPRGRFGRPLFQAMSYHDTPEAPLARMRFEDYEAGPGRHEYRIIVVNGAELRSAPSPAASVP